MSENNIVPVQDNSEVEMQNDGVSGDNVTADQGPKFADFGISEITLKNLLSMGFDTPTPVQSAVIPLLLEKNTDVIALAKTGTGKTAAFGIPLIEKIDATSRAIQALVLCPTRELASQVAQHIKNYSKGKGIKVTTILGGESYQKQTASLREGPQIIVSTPGRLIDLMEQKIVALTTVEYLVLDEADEMLSMGFQESLERILQDLQGDNLKTWLFSATMDARTQGLTKKYLKSPEKVTLHQTVEVSRVESFAGVVFEEDKEDALTLLISNEPEFYGIVFVQTKQQVANLEIAFRRRGFEVDSLHGDKAQADRKRTVQRFKNRETTILFATDVAARGLDIENLSHVVNFDIPWDVETYTHRIGRTARAGKTGTVWTFVRPKESGALKRFERGLKFEFKPIVIPTIAEVQSNRIIKWLESVDAKTVGTKEHDLFMKVASKLADSSLGETINSPEVQLWMFKVLSLLGYGKEWDMKQPRSLSLRPSGDRASSGGGGDRRSSGSYGGRGGDRGERSNSYSGDRDRGERSNDRGFGGGGRPRSSGISRPYSSGGDRSASPRRFSRDSDRSFDRSFESRPERSERSESPRFERSERPSFDRAERSDRPAAERSERPRNDRYSAAERPRKTFTPRTEGFDEAPAATERKGRSFGLESRSASSGAGRSSDRPASRAPRSRDGATSGTSSDRPARAFDPDSRPRRRRE